MSVRRKLFTSSFKCTKELVFSRDDMFSGKLRKPTYLQKGGDRSKSGRKRFGFSRDVMKSIMRYNVPQRNQRGSTLRV